MKQYYLKFKFNSSSLTKKRLIRVGMAVFFIAVAVLISALVHRASLPKEMVMASSANSIFKTTKVQLERDKINRDYMPMVASNDAAVNYDFSFITELPKSNDPDFPAKYSAVYNKNGHKCVYLTFDDGPSYLTPCILDVLKKYNVKATFFVVGAQAQKHPEIVRRASQEGHLVANHSYSHDYKALYASVASFEDEILKTQNILKNIIGADKVTNLMRMPGGAQPEYKADFKKAADKMGMVFIDWNAVNGDGSTNHLTVAQSIANVDRFASYKDDLVLLMHDAGTKKTTYESLEQNIINLKKRGFAFKRLNEYDENTVDVSNPTT